jgi:hypothetical protein
MKTAVEWLVEEINKLTGLTIIMDEPCVQQANKMFEEQIIETWVDGVINWDSEKEAQQYYNETFNI